MCSLMAAQGLAGVLETLLLRGIAMGSMSQAGKPGITDSLAHPMWDYSAHKSRIYLLRERQIHVPSVDTWTAEEGAVPPSLLPAPWMGRSLPGQCGCWEEHLVGERCESLPLAAATSAESRLSLSGVQGPGKKPENTVPDTFLFVLFCFFFFRDTYPRLGLTLPVRPASPAPRSQISKRLPEMYHQFFPWLS